MDERFGPPDDGAGPELSPRVSVVIPALNEADNIDWVLQRIPALASEVVLVDGLSTDRTEALARTIRPDLVVVHQHTPGKGAALRAGFAASTGDIVMMLDADGSTDPREIGTFVRALEHGADFVKGSRTLAGGGSEDFTLLRQAGNRLFVSLVNLLYGARFTDLCYGYCAFWRSNLEALELTADGFEIETALVLGALRASLRIEEVASLELKRRAGKSNLHAFKDGRRILKTILRERFPSRLSGGKGGGRIRLVAVEKASLEGEGWRPAGHDSRRGDRRRLDRFASGYDGPERRVRDRRRPPPNSATVYVASVEPEGAVLLPPLVSPRATKPAVAQ